jgi:hypothetical protein
MKKDMYIGVRLSASDMETILGRPVVVLNERLTRKIRSAAVRKGVVGAKKGIKWFFYRVSYEEYSNLINPAMRSFVAVKDSIKFNPLLSMSYEQLAGIIDGVNIKYKGRPIGSEYSCELKDKIFEVIEKLNDEN